MEEKEYLMRAGSLFSYVDRFWLLRSIAYCSYVDELYWNMRNWYVQRTRACFIVFKCPVYNPTYTKLVSPHSTYWIELGRNSVVKHVVRCFMMW